MGQGTDERDKPDAPKRPAAYTPVLGLFADGEARPTALPQAQETSPHMTALADEALELSVIVPARDEAAHLPACLESLTAQHEAIFALGKDWEIVVVDDASTDRTREFAEKVAGLFPGIKVIAAPPLAPDDGKRAPTGKNNACWAGAEVAQGRWLLFTDADTRHEPGDLRRAMHEAERHQAALLSYSPLQRMRGIAQHLVTPLIFSELASSYPPAKVNDPADRTAAANGQFLLIRRGTYFAVGGHRAVAGEVLEDVELARLVKRAKGNLRLRYAPEALSTQMYGGFRDMVEGWTKNLALLFPHALRLALWRLLDLLLLLLPLLLWALPYLVTWQRVALVALWARTLLRFYQRVGRAHFPFWLSAIEPLGLPLFIGLLIASFVKVRVQHRVSWKGREYRV